MEFFRAFFRNLQSGIDRIYKTIWSPFMMIGVTLFVIFLLFKLIGILIEAFNLIKSSDIYIKN